MEHPLAYFITFTTYGAWLPGRDPGWVDDRHNQPGAQFLQPDPIKVEASKLKMANPDFLLDEPSRQVVLKTMLEVASRREWRIRAAHVRSNHLHVVVTAACPPEKVMNDFKAWASRRLNEAFGKRDNRWTQHGSTLYLWSGEKVKEKINYTVRGQGAPMAVYEEKEGSE
ncbi:MAG: hypothetical protein EXR99_08705 [Gemmataceae bacterium]|nr:hypothetical protein [Gemmataceae bacterium]